MTDIRVSDVVTTAGTQSRAELSDATVAEYAEAIQNGAVMPPIIVFHDGSGYWLADGFHRVMAYARLGVEWITAEVKVGTKRDAVLWSVGANSSHGLPRTNADKRRAVMMLLEDQEWSAWSDREISRRCMVSHQLVANLRPSLSTVDSEKPAKTYTTKHGTVATMNTENIGKKEPSLPEGKLPEKERLAQIAELAAQGFRGEQISKEIGLGVVRVREIAKRGGIELPDRLIKSQKFDNRRIIEQTVLSLEASAQGIKAIPAKFDGIDPAQLSEWLASMSESMAIFRRFHASLKEASNV